MTASDPSNFTVTSLFASISIFGNETWEYLPSPGPISNAVFVSDFPYLYAFGGCRHYTFILGPGTTCVNMSSDLMTYNLLSKEWSIADTNMFRSEGTAVLTPGKVLYVYGGKNKENEIVGDLIYLGMWVI